MQLGGGKAEAMFAQAYRTNYHTTALCSPGRGALLTGRNPHASSVRRRAAFATRVASPFPWRRDYHG
jgi:arylsulfatase A-like enzyme